MISIVLAEDHHIVRKGIIAILAKVEDIEVIGEAEDGAAAVELVEKLKPDVLVTDINMPRLNGTEVIEKLRLLGSPTRVIMLSSFSDGALVRQAVKQGAYGYLLKTSVMDELLLAIRAARRGEMYLSPAVSDAVIGNGASFEDEQPFEMLTPRQREVLKLIVEGNTNREIARLLLVSIKTVEKHRASLMTKLDVHDLAGLVRVAYQKKLIPFDE